MNSKLKNLIEAEKDNPSGLLISLFCNNLKSCREYLKLTQAEIAKRLNIPGSTYANWEQGRREPSITDIYNLMYVFDITPNDLFEAD